MTVISIIIRGKKLSSQVVKRKKSYPDSSEKELQNEHKVTANTKNNKMEAEIFH